MIWPAIANLIGRIDRRSRCNALGYDYDLPVAEGPAVGDTARRPLSPSTSPALAADAGDAPGEVSGGPLASPSPGDLPDSTLCLVAAETISGLCYLMAGGTHSLEDLVAALRARAEVFAFLESIEP